MLNKIAKSTLTALFLSVSIHAADATPTHMAPPPGRPVSDQDNVPRSAYLNFRITTSPLVGQKVFCQHQPTECQRNMKPQRIHLTPRVYQALRGINALVNRSVLPETDLVQYNVEEIWRYPNSGAGDCEDYQLLKQKLLHAAGVPQSALRHAHVFENGENHDVLMVRTDRGDFVLDNLSNEVRTVRQTGYQFIKVLSPGSDYAWKTWNAAAPATAFSASSVDNDEVVRLSDSTLARLERTASGHNKSATSGLRTMSR